MLVIRLDAGHGMHRSAYSSATRLSSGYQQLRRLWSQGFESQDRNRPSSGPFRTLPPCRPAVCLLSLGASASSASSVAGAFGAEVTGERLKSYMTYAYHFPDATWLFHATSCPNPGVIHTWWAMEGERSTLPR